MDLVRDRETGAYLQPRYAHAPLLHSDAERSDTKAGDGSRTSYFAVVDTGLLYDHPLLAGRIDAEFDLTGEGLADEHGHGTLVALLYLNYPGTRAVRLVNVKAVGRSGRGTTEQLVRAFAWLSDFKRSHPDDAVIVNASLGVRMGRWLGLGSCRGSCRVCKAATATAASDVLILAAAGNEANTTYCPAAAARYGKSGAILSVAAADFPASGIGQTEGPARAISGVIGVAATHAFEGRVGAKFLFETAYDLSHADQKDQAEKAYELVVGMNEDPISSQAAFNLGVLREARGELESARRAYDYAAKSTDKGLAAHAAQNIGVLLSRSDPPAAERAFRAVIATNDSEQAPKARHNLGRLLGQQRRWKEAADEFRAAADASDAEVAAWASHDLGIALCECRQPGAALKAYLTAANSRHEEAATSAALGIGLLLENDDPGQARDAYETASASSLDAVRTEAIRGLERLGQTGRQARVEDEPEP
jgi:hypothetical protein